MATSATSSITPQPSIRERIETWCRENSFALGNYGNCKHGCGLPHIECAWVRPEWSPVDGDHVLLVGAESVIQAVCPYPWGHHDWEVRATYRYSTQEELKGILDRLVRKPQGCWR